MKFFKKTEFFCPGGCMKNFNDINEFAYQALEKAREVADVPFIISSSIRCQHHNEYINGSPTSLHLSGNAFDIVCDRPDIRHRIIYGAMAAGFSEIIIYPRHVHLGYNMDKTKMIAIGKY